MRHASSIPIGLNPGSGAITSNFHVVFDDWFGTVLSTVKQLPDLNSVELKAIFGDSEYQYPLDNDPIGNAGTAPYDPPLSMDSFNIDDSRCLPAPPPDGPPQQRDQPQQRETPPEPTPPDDDAHPELIPRVSPGNPSKADDVSPLPLVCRSDILDDHGHQPSMPRRWTPQPLIWPPSTWTTPAVERERPAVQQQAPSQTPISESTTPRTRVERELRALGNHK
jgi:hypothetical protein